MMSLKFSAAAVGLTWDAMPYLDAQPVGVVDFPLFLMDAERTSRIAGNNLAFLLARVPKVDALGACAGQPIAVGCEGNRLDRRIKSMQVQDLLACIEVPDFQFSRNAA